MSAIDDLERRRDLLVAQCDLQRLHLTLAWREMRTIVAPAPSPQRAVWARPKVAAFLNVALPLLGARRLGRVVRVLSFGLMAFRAIRGWR